MLLSGSWEGDAQIPAAKCRDATGTTVLCCVDDFSQPLSIRIKLKLGTDKLVYEYKTLFSGGKYVYQPILAIALDVMEQKRVDQVIFVRTALSIDSSACFYIYEGSTADSILVAVRTRSKYLTGTWTEEYWCEEAPAPLVGGCTLGAEWPSRSQQMNNMTTSWWYTSIWQLHKESSGPHSKSISQEAEQNIGFAVGVAVAAAAAASVVIAVLLFLLWCRRRKLSGVCRHEPPVLKVPAEAEAPAAESHADASTDAKDPRLAPDRLGAADAAPESPGTAADPYLKRYCDYDAGDATEPDLETYCDSDTRTWGPVQIFDSGLREHWLLEMGDITLEQAVSGKGAYGDVRRGLLFNATPVAVKTCRTASNKSISALANEMRLLRRVRHPNIVLFFGVHVSEGNLGLVLEWVEGMNLKNYVLKAFSPCKDDQQVVSGSGFVLPWVGYFVHRPKLLMDVSSGMQFLHAQRPPILHCDLKPSNVLVETVAVPPRAKITDFGLSVLLPGGDIQGIAGTKLYMAPEVIAGLPSNASADIFSFGCTTCFAFTGLNVNQNEVQGTTQSALIGANVPESMLQVIVACLQREPVARPNFIQIRSVLHEWACTQVTSGIDSDGSGDPTAQDTRSIAVSVELIPL